jgi:hypothetical protein
MAAGRVPQQRDILLLRRTPHARPLRVSLHGPRPSLRSLFSLTYTPICLRAQGRPDFFIAITISHIIGRLGVG